MCHTDKVETRRTFRLSCFRFFFPLVSMSNKFVLEVMSEFTGDWKFLLKDGCVSILFVYSLTFWNDSTETLNNIYLR